MAGTPLNYGIAPLRKLLFSSIQTRPPIRLRNSATRPGFAAIEASRPRHRICIVCQRTKDTTRRYASTKPPASSPQPATSEASDEKLTDSHIQPPSSSSLTRSTPTTTSTTDHSSILTRYLQPTVTTLSNLLNDLTGYTPLLKLKHELDTLSTQLATASTRLSSLRQTHNSLHSRRASHLRETNALLSRKDSWTPADLERFTSLYRAEHALEADVAAASEALARAEAQQDRLRAKVDLALLTRYHEEQIWSDKIRRLGSWTAVGLFALNLALWAVNLFGVEPWRRRKLVAGFEEKVESALDERLGELTRPAMVAVDSEGDVTTGRPTETAAPAEETLPAGPEQQQPAATAPATLDVKAANGALLDGLSGHDGDRVVSVTLGTMSALVLEGALTGAVAGAAVASTIFLLRRTA